MHEIIKTSSVASHMQAIRELIPEASESLNAVFSRLEQSLGQSLGNEQLEKLLELIEHLEELAEKILFTK